MAGRKLTKEQKEAIVLLGGALSGPVLGPTTGAIATRIATIGATVATAITAIACDTPTSGTVQEPTNDDDNNEGENGGSSGGSSGNSGDDNNNNPPPVTETPEQIAAKELAQLTNNIKSAGYDDTTAPLLANIITQDKQGSLTLANLAYAVSKKNQDDATTTSEVVRIIELTKSTAAATKTNVEFAFAFKGVLDSSFRSKPELNSVLMPEGKRTWEQRRGGLDGEILYVAQHLAIVDNAAAIESNLATVFLGDGLILEAVGGKTSDQIKNEMSNIPTPKVHVAAIEGATVEEIKWGIENGWLPTKTAYTVVHGGRAEVMGNESSLTTSNQSAAEPFGVAIGRIYTSLKTVKSDTSVIFSGIIPPSDHSIHSDNIYYINGNNGIKSGSFGTDIDNDYIKMMTPNNVTAFKNLVNNLAIKDQPTNVAMSMLKSNDIYLANKKMDYKYYMAMANTGSAGVSVTFLASAGVSVTFFGIGKRRGVSHLFWDSLTRTAESGVSHRFWIA
jgi:hypothetical protein